MAEAKAPTASYLPGEDLDTLEANRRYQEALAKLTESLDSRKNRFFDPTMLAMAQGFLAPTQTGGFGESLGNVAAKVGPAEAAAAKEEQDIAQQKFAVAGQGLDLQRLKARDTDISKFLAGDQPPTAAPAPAGPLSGPQAAPIAGPKAGPLSGAPAPVDLAPAPSVAPVGALTQAAVPAPAAPATEVPEVPVVAPRPMPKPAPQPAQQAAPQVAPQGALTTAKSPQGIQIMPGNPAYMSQKEFVALNRSDKSKSMADLLAKGAEMERHRYAKTEAGTTDYKTGLFYPSPSSKYVDMPIMGEGYGGKTYSMPESVALQLTHLAQQNNFDGYKALADKFTGRAFGNAPPTTGGSKEEREQNKKLEDARIAEEIENRKDFNQRKKDADETITTANVFRKFASEPNAKAMFGILNDNKISSGIATLVRDGIGLPGFTVGTKSIEDVMRNAELKPADQAKYRTFLMYAAQMQLQQSKYMKGAVSDFEQRLMGNAGINGQDTPESIRMKADLMTRRAQFDRRVAKEFKGSKMTADEFLDSDKYNEMRDKYNEDLAELSSGSKVLAPNPAKPTAPAAGGAEPSKDFIRDKDTGVIRKKRAGE